MKRTLEAILVAAAVALSVFVARQWRLRREAAALAGAADPSLRPGTDAETPGAAAPRGVPGSVVGVPMVRLKTPPRKVRAETKVPPPPEP
jgi:hypothetical protein